MADDPDRRDGGLVRAPGAGATPATTGVSATDDDTLPLDASQPTSPDHVKFQRGRAAIALLEVIRCVQPERLADLAHPDSPTVGNDLPPTIGRFQVLRELGRGGHGVVLLAYDPHLNRRVALKVPRPETLLTADLRRRFLREAETAAALNHPHIVPIFERGAVGPLCYVACGYCPGPSLAEWLSRQADPVPLRQAAQIVRTLADAVQHAHSRGVLHRDLKPANVLLSVEDEDEQSDALREPDTPPAVNQAHSESATDAISTSFPTPYIIDFGLARVEGASGHTASTAIVGTPAYMSPEQAAGKNQELTAAADIYGLGTIFYQLLTRQLPFHGRSDLETLQAVQFQEPTAPRRIRAEIPRDLEAICLKCLEKDPRQRYASAASLYADLGRFLDGAPVEARAISRRERLRRWIRRNPALAAVTGIAAALFLVGSIGVTWQWRRAERSLVEVRDQQDRAARNLRTAQEAVDELLTDLATELGNLPQTETIRERLLKRAALINQRFLRDESVDPATANQQSIEAWYRAGEIAWQLKDLRQTEAAMRRVIALSQSLSAQNQTADILAKCAGAHCRLSSVAAARNDWEASERCLQDGLTLLERTPAMFTNERELWRAELLRSLGIDAERHGQLEQAGKYFGTAMDLVRQQPPKQDERDRLALIRAKVHNSFAIHCKQTGRLSEAVEHFQATQDLVAKLRERSPDSAEFQAMAAQNQYNLANLDLATEQYDQARARYLRAKNDFKQLAAKFPSVVTYRDLWCHCLQNAAIASKSPEQLDSRLIMLKKAAFLREEILREHPELVDNAVQLAKTYRSLGKDHVLAEQYDDARRCFRRSIECFSGSDASSPVQIQDCLNDASVCSLIARLENACENWNRAISWFERAISTRQAVLSQPDDQDDQVRDQAALGVALVRAGRVDEGIRHIRQLPASTTERPVRDYLAALALFDIAEILQAQESNDQTGRTSIRDLRIDAIAQLRRAWQHGDDKARDFTLSPRADFLGDIPQYQQLAAEMRDSLDPEPKADPSTAVN